MRRSVVRLVDDQIGGREKVDERRIERGVARVTWWSNLLASSVLYALAGMFWNLAYAPGIGVVFAFRLAEWPAPPAAGGTRRVLLVGALFMVVVAGLMAPFAWEAVRALRR